MGYLEKAKQNGIESNIIAYKPEMLQKLAELVAIPSLPTYTTPDGIPMGPEVIRALHYALELSEQLGFRVHNEDDKYGWAEVGESGPLVCIFTHLDIVPVGDNWTKEPFVVSEEDGWLYGRGILDNKGPAIASLYALKVCCDQNIDWPCRIRVWFGTNEENGMNDVQMYIHKYGAPDYSFVPDSQFPLSYSELGTSHFVIRKNYLPQNVQAPVQLVSFRVKPHANVVPPLVHVTLRAQSQPMAEEICRKLAAFAEQKQYAMSAECDGCEVTVESRGHVADHWNEPWTAVNALAQLVVFLDTLDLGEEPGKLIHFVASKIGTDTDGKKLGIDATTETASLAVAMESAALDEFGLSFDFFVIAPAEIRCEVMLDTILRQLRSDGMDLVVRSLGPGFLRDKDMPLLRLLYESYSDVTGNTDPIKVCGGTYAKFVPNAIPFGAIFSAQKDICHTPNERIEVEDLLSWTKIYSNALLRIADYISQQT